MFEGGTLLTVQMPDFGSVLADAKAAVERDQADCLRILGTSLMSKVALAFTDKSRHGTGSDGVKWPELKRATLAARVRKRGKGKQIVESRKKIAEQIAALLGQKVAIRKPPKKSTRRKLKATTRLREQVVQQRRIKRATASHARLKSTPKEKGVAGKVLTLRIKRAQLLVQLEQLIMAALQSHQVGVDTGIMQNSGSPGFQGPVQSSELTVGYSIEYAEYFDESRTLIPATLPAPWQQDLEKKAADWGANIFQGKFDSL